MSAALSRGWRKGVRTIAQVAAGGALTALVVAVVGHLPPALQGLVMGAWTALVAFAHNWLETAGKIPTMLPTPGLVVGSAADVVATVEATTTPVGGIVGDVVDTGGDVVGKVIGALDNDELGRVTLPVVLLVAAAIILGALAFCGDALFDDESEENDLGHRTELVHGGDECADSRDECSDDDFSPTLQDSPIIICLRPDSCRFEEGSA